MKAAPAQPDDRKRGRAGRIAKAVLKRLVVVALLVGVVRLGGCMERLFYYPVAGPTPPPPHAQGVWFEAKDGTRLFGWWIPAHGRVAGDAPAPTILHLHGNAGNIQDHAWFTQHLPPAGFNVFIFDYRGYGQSGGGTLRRTKLIQDALAALDAVLARPDVDPQRVGMYGQSLGGAIGIPVMADRPEVRAAVFESPFASWREVAAAAVGGDPPGGLGRVLAWLFISDSHSPLDAIARIRCPILLLHGSADDIVPVSHSERLAKAAPGYAEVRVYPGGMHNTLKDTHPEVADAMIEFFRARLGSE